MVLERQVERVLNDVWNNPKYDSPEKSFDSLDLPDADHPLFNGQLLLLLVCHLQALDHINRGDGDRGNDCGKQPFQEAVLGVVLDQHFENHELNRRVWDIAHQVGAHPHKEALDSVVLVYVLDISQDRALDPDLLLLDNDLARSVQRNPAGLREAARKEADEWINEYVAQ